MNGNDLLRPRSDVRFRIVGGEAVVVLQESGQVLALNEVGARILQLIDRGLAVPRIIDHLEEEFDAERSDLEVDTADFVRELLDGGVIEVVSVAGEERCGA